MGEDNFKNIMTMVEAYKKADKGTSEKVEAAK